MIGLEEKISAEDGALPELSLDSDLLDSSSIQWDTQRPSEGDSLELKCEGLSSSGKVSYCLGGSFRCVQHGIQFGIQRLNRSSACHMYSISLEVLLRSGFISAMHYVVLCLRPAWPSLRHIYDVASRLHFFKNLKGMAFSEPSGSIAFTDKAIVSRCHYDRCKLAAGCLQDRFRLCCLCPFCHPWRKAASSHQQSQA